MRKKRTIEEIQEWWRPRDFTPPTPEEQREHEEWMAEADAHYELAMRQEERPVEAAAFRRLAKYVEGVQTGEQGTGGAPMNSDQNYAMTYARMVLEQAATELEAGRDF